MHNITANEFLGTQAGFTYDIRPDRCPFCHKSITARIYQAFRKEKKLEIVFGCPDSNCGRIFLSQYERTSNVDNTFFTKALL